MMKKSKQASADILKAKEKAREINQKAQEVQQLVDQAQSEIELMEQAEKQALEEERLFAIQTADQIRQIATDSKFFCGITLSPQDLTNIMQLMMESRENVRIEFQLYSLE
jgi:hypothetical protein